MPESSRHGELPLLKAFIHDIRRFPLLSKEQEAALVAQAVSGDKTAENRLVESNLRFVVKVAFSYWQWAVSRYPGISLMDLLQAGCIGLIESVKKVDPARQTRVLTYAALGIGWRMRRVTELYRRHMVCRSLDDPLNDSGDSEDERTLLDEIPADNESADVSAYHRSIRGLVERLSPRQKRVLLERYWSDKTLDEIGLLQGVSGERIRRIESRALLRLRLELKKAREVKDG